MGERSAKGVTESQFLTAVERLKGRGIPITIRNVRDALGRGSYSTIQRLLAGYKANALEEARGAELHEPDSPLAPVAPELERLGLAVTRLEATFRDELDKLYERFDSVQRIMLAEIDRARDRSKHAQETLGLAGEKARVIEQALRGRIAQLEEQLRQANAKLAALEPESDEAPDEPSPVPSFDDEDEDDEALFGSGDWR